MTDFVIARAVADIHHDPDGESELVTQALMNVPVVAGDSSGDWTQITLPDYTGWIRSEELEAPIIRGFCAEADGAEGMDGGGTCGIALPYSVVVMAPHAALYRYNRGEAMLCELGLATVLPYIDLAHPQRLRVALPGEGEGWLAREDVDVRGNQALFPLQPVGVVTGYAKAFLGTPYLWGGTSWRGIDCSGLVQLCYRMGGICLPRDADQQHDVLTERVERENLQAGDLIFFGRERITHVALALNKYEYIHAEGQDYNQVTIHSLDASHPIYHADLAQRIRAIKRVMPVQQ